MTLPPTQGGSVPLFARAAAFFAFACALAVPIWDGARDLPALLFAAGLVAAGLLVSGVFPRGPGVVANWTRAGLIVCGLIAVAVLTHGMPELVPEGQPLSSPLILALIWMLAVSSGFFFMPDGPLSAFCVAGALIAISAHLDYGAVGPSTTVGFVFFCVLYDLAAGGPGAAMDADAGEQRGPMVELAVALSLAISALGLAVYLVAPFFLPDLSGLGPAPESPPPTAAQGQQPDVAASGAAHRAGSAQGGQGAEHASGSWAEQHGAAAWEAGGSQVTGRPASPAAPAPAPPNRSDAWLRGVRAAAGSATDSAAEQAERAWPALLALAVLAAAAVAAGKRRLQRLKTRVLQLIGKAPPDLMLELEERDFLEKLARRGLIREPFETLHEFHLRLRSRGQAPRSLAGLVDLSVRARYSGRTPSRADRQMASRLLDELDVELAAWTLDTGRSRPLES